MTEELKFKTEVKYIAMDNLITIEYKGRHKLKDLGDLVVVVLEGDYHACTINKANFISLEVGPDLKMVASQQLTA